jgi:hypothetical protein
MAAKCISHASGKKHSIKVGMITVTSGAVLFMSLPTARKQSTNSLRFKTYLKHKGSSYVSQMPAAILRPK